jgi:Cu-processing system permease protein
MERGTMLLLLSYPIGRWQVILGKFMGHLAILSFATLVGYGAAAAALAATGVAIDAASWWAFLSMILFSVMLGAVFVAIGYLVSALVAERGTAGGIAIGVWLFFVLIYDMALLGMLVVDQGRTISGGTLNVLLLLNPTDAYRLLNLGSGNAGSLSGLGGIAENVALGRSMLVSALAVWTLLPLAAATMVFSRREL